MSRVVCNKARNVSIFLRRHASVSQVMKRRSLYHLSKFRQQSYANNDYHGSDDINGKKYCKMNLVNESEALEGSDIPLFKVSDYNYVTQNSMYPPFPKHHKLAIFGMGCFWSSELCFLNNFNLLKGIYSTQVGYIGGYTKNPTYEQVKSSKTGHIEVVRVVYDPNIIKYNQLLEAFWQKHNPTQGMRQGEDYGTQYRSAIICLSDCQKIKAIQSKMKYEEELQTNPATRGLEVTTEIVDGNDMEFYYAEDYHQQYFVKNPDEQGTCTMKGIPLPKMENNNVNENIISEIEPAKVYQNYNYAQEVIGIPLSVIDGDKRKRYESCPVFSKLETLYYDDYQEYCSDSNRSN